MTRKTKWLGLEGIAGMQEGEVWPAGGFKGSPDMRTRMAFSGYLWRLQERERELKLDAWYRKIGEQEAKK